MGVEAPSTFPGGISERKFQKSHQISWSPRFFDDKSARRFRKQSKPQMVHKPDLEILLSKIWLWFGFGAKSTTPESCTHVGLLFLNKIDFTYTVWRIGLKLKLIEYFLSNPSGSWKTLKFYLPDAHAQNTAIKGSRQYIHGPTYRSWNAWNLS